jgi:RNA polymerase sigma-70 factor, ECF subfamily
VTLAALRHVDAAGTAVSSAAPGNDAEADLLGAIGRGDPDALGLLYDRYGRLALAVAYRVLGDYHAAEDAVQDAFLAVWRRVDSFDRRRGAVRGWLLTIVRNAAVDRRRGRHAHSRQDAPLDDEAFRLATEDEATFAVVASSVEARRVREALAGLPAEQREAIELAYFGGLTHQEIAERTGAALGTVKGRLRLGLHKLRAALADLIPPDASGPVPSRLQSVPDEPRKPGHDSALAVAGRWFAPQSAVRGGPALLAPAG